MRQNDFGQWLEPGQTFEPHFLDLRREKTVKRQCIVNTLKHFVLVSNANLIRNSDALLTRKKKDIEVNWVRKMKPRVPSEKF